MNVETVYRQRGENAVRNIAGETLLVPVSRDVAALDRLVALNSVGSYIWGRLDGQRPLSDIIEGVVRRFDVDSDRAEVECCAFMGSLLAAGLITEVADSEP